MSLKSLCLSILSLVVAIGLLFGTTFLFSVQTILGIIGIVLLIVLPVIIRHKALDEAKGIIDEVFAKYIIPIVMVIAGTMVVFMLLGWIPSFFK